MIKKKDLGDGKFGIVYTCRFNELPGMFVIKEFKIQSNLIESSNDFKQEKKILQIIDHPNYSSSWIN